MRILNTYLYYFLQSAEFRSVFSDNISGIIGGVSIKKLKEMLIPIPPLEEQKRIVAKIEELLPLVERYDTAYTKLTELNLRFPTDLQKSLLNLAVRGKLVEQRAEEGTGKGIPIEEAPFDIPKTWRWQYLGKCCEMYTGDSISENVKATKYVGLKEGYDYIATKDVSFSHIISYDNGVRIPFENDFRRAYKDTILMCIEGGSAGRKIAILDRDVCFGNKLCMFKPKGILNTYLYYFLQSAEFRSVFSDNISGIIGGVSIKKLKEMLIPIPPLEEQKRIVTKLEQLLPFVDNLK